MEISVGGGSYSGPKEISYLFVDGGYLRKIAQRFGDELFGGAEPPVNYGALGSQFTKCFYYDCLPAQRGNEAPETYEARVSEQRAQLSAIRSLHGWHVIEGVIAGKGSRARQKQVDVHIAVDMLTHSYRRNMHHATFVAGDQDFKPLVEAVVREGMFIEIWFEPSSASVDLLDAADARRPLDLYTFFERYVDRGFRELHPLPRRGQSAEPIEGLQTPERVGESASARVELFRSHDGYTIVRREGVPGRASPYLTHSDPELLERVFEMLYGDVRWVENPATLLT